MQRLHTDFALECCTSGQSPSVVSKLNKRDRGFRTQVNCPVPVVSVMQFGELIWEMTEPGKRNKTVSATRMDIEGRTRLWGQEKIGHACIGIIS